MKKSTLAVIITVVLLNMAAYIYEVKFNTCSESTRAGAERLINVCTTATAELSKDHDELTARQNKISAKANQLRDVRDKKVSSINAIIKTDVVFHKGQK